MQNRLRRSWVTLHLAVICLPITGHAATQDRTSTVEFVVGGLTEAEGGDWQPDTSPLRRPFGIDFSSDGTMYLVELEGGRVHRLPTGGAIERYSGDGSKAYTGDGGPASRAQFNGMHNCVVARNDRLLIADTWNHCVRRIDLNTGRIDTLAGTGTAGFSGDGGPASAAQFDYVMCIALNPSKSVLHITDLRNHRIRNLDLESGVVTTVAGNGAKGRPTEGEQAVNTPLVDPRAAASDANGNLYILERGGHALRVVRSDGTLHTVAGTGARGFRDGDARHAQFASPKHLCCDPDGNVYVADDLNRAIRKYDPRTRQVTSLLGRGHGDPRITLLNPHGVRWHAGALYVVDSGHHRVLRIATSD